MNQVTLIRELIQSKFICAVSDEASYNWLKDAENYQQMNDKLDAFGAKLVSFDDGEVFAAVNKERDDYDKNKVVKDFTLIHNDIRNIVDIITTLACADEYGNTLYSGMVLKQDALIIAANNNRDFEIRLQKTAKITGSESKPNDEKIAALLARLQKDELIKLVNVDKKIYRVTGKIAYVMSVIEYINENYIPKDDEVETSSQRELGL